MTALASQNKILVVGAGAMGSGIAHVAARAGHAVYLADQNAEALARGKAGIEKDLRFLVGKGKLAAAEADAILARIVPITQLDAGRDALLAIEAIVEDLDVKRSLFAQLESLLPAEAILATNTSSLSITAMASRLQRPQRLAGMHFFNPAPRMALVEVVNGLATAPEIVATLLATARAWGKIAVQARSTPGFIVNRVARPYYAEALRVLEEGGATPATLDALLREGCGFPMGPFELMDLIGHDVNFAVTRSVFDAYFGDQRFLPSLIQQELVQAGRLGRKSGHGFYRYDDQAARPAPDIVAAQPAPARITVQGDLGPATALVERFAAAGIAIERTSGTSCLRIGNTILALSDGRPATIRAAQDGIAALVLFDLALDYAQAPRLAVAKADQCAESDFLVAVAALQAAGLQVSCLDDGAGLVALRTLCMLANEGADAVNRGVASAEDVDAAMRHGTNYPRGPLEWARAFGIARVVAVLENLQRHYGEDRYRVSPWLRRQAALAGNTE